MLGHKQIIELRKQRGRPKAVFIHIAEHPKFSKDMDNPEKALLRGELPSVFTGKTPANRADLTWVKNLQVHLVEHDDMELYLKWWCALVDAQPRFLISVCEGEISTWKM
jgi:hypothetical protein